MKRSRSNRRPKDMPASQASQHADLGQELKALSEFPKLFTLDFARTENIFIENT